MAEAVTEERQRQEFLDYLQARQELESFDAAAWEASIAQREQMPRFELDALDPRPDALGKGRAATFVADGPAKASVRAAKPGAVELGFVRAVQVSSREGFVPGTLILPVAAKDLDGVDPRGLRLFRWDEAAGRYALQLASGLNVEGGYAWGRITAPGRYAAFGMPLPDAIQKAGDTKRLRVSGELDHLMQLMRVSAASNEPWQSLGPSNLSCCIFDLALDPNDDRVYAAASDGGIWRLDSVYRYPHETWVPLTDQQPSLKVSAVAVSEADHNLVYYADSEGQLFRSPNRGYGWEPAGSMRLGQVSRILTHPSDSNRVFVASSSGFWSSPSRGMTWDSNPGQASLLDGEMSDAEIDPTEPAAIYLGQRNVGVVKTTDGGATWRTVLPWSAAAAPVDNTIKVAVGGQGTPTNRTVAAKLDQQVFVSRSAGESTPGGPMAWRSEGSFGGTGQGYWNSVVAVDPHDDQVILAGAQELFRRDPQGNWSQVASYYAPHEDQHRVTFDRNRPGIAYLANDGGVFRSIDGGKTWQTKTADDVAAGRDLTSGLVTGQLFAAGVAQGHALANAYHQGLLGSNILSTGEWFGVEGHGWEFSNVVGDPFHPGVHYVLNPGALFRRIFPEPASGPALTQISSFVPTSLAIDPSTGLNGLLVGTASGTIVRTTNSEGNPPSWTTMAGISLSGEAVVSVAYAPPALPQQAYTLTQGSRVFVCDDVYGAAGWHEVTGLPTGGARQIVVSPNEARQVFALASDTPYRSIDGGTTWSAIRGSGASALPTGSQPVALVALPEALFLAAQSGIYMSPDHGQTWFPETFGLPNVQITGLLWEGNDLFAVTNGRGLWHRHPYIPEQPPVEHKLDAATIIALWKAIHGGDPPRELVAKIGIHAISLQAQRRKSLGRKGPGRAPSR